MPYYGLTVQSNKRHSYSKDRAIIEGFIDLLKARKEVSEISDIFFEIGSKGNHLLHTHFLLISKRPPYLKLKVFQDYMKANAVHVDIQFLRTKLSLARWIRYCHKTDTPAHNTHDAYEESWRPIRKRILWPPQVTTA